MNYKNIYDKLISRAKTRDSIMEFEKHHVIPKCMGGSDDIENIVKLTIEEHYFAHQLLAKMHPDNHKLNYAAVMMCTGRPSNKLYGWLRRRHMFFAKQRVGSLNGSFGRRWYMNPVTLETGKFLDDEVPNGWIKGRRIKLELKPRKTTKCIICDRDTQSYKAKWCCNCKEAGPIRQEKQKSYFSDEEKLNALKMFNGKIRPALFHLGLNDSGVHYKKMKELKASLYPLATNQLKG